MNDLALSPVRKAGFSLEPMLNGSVLRVAFAGTGDMATVPVLASFLKHVHGEARRLGVLEVTFDLTELYFMNSSCFKSFVTWISQVASLDQKARYRIKFRTNQQLLWQRRSLEALRCLATDVISIES
jgi:hypothetical protein